MQVRVLPELLLIRSLTVVGVDEIKNQIHHCDYLAMLRQIPDESVDLILTDPPYGIGFQSHVNTNRHDVLENDEGDFSYEPLAREALRVLKPNTAAFFFTGWSVYPDHFHQVKRAGFKMRTTLIVQKNMTALGYGEGDFAGNSEWCIFAVKGSFKFRQTNLMRNKCVGAKWGNGISGKSVGEYKLRFPACWFGDEFPIAAEPPSFQEKYRHPTPKGQEFFIWLIKISTDPGALVVDPFSGSGTTAAASILSDRNFIACDVNPEFVTTGRRRISRSHIGGFM